MHLKLCSWLVGFATLVAIPAMAKEELKVTTFVVPDQALLKVVQEWAKDLEEKSDGELSFVFFPSSQMGPPDRQFDLARTGVADLALFLHGFSPGRFPLTEVGYLPGLFTNAETGGRAMWEVADHFASEHAGTKILAIHPTGPIRVFSRNKSFPSMAELSGQRVRHGGSAVAESLRSLNAVPVAVPAPEMNDALLKGLIDGIATSYEAVGDWKMEDTVTDVLETPIGVATFALVINQARYDALPENLRELIDSTSGSPLSMALGRSTEARETEMTTLLEQKNVKVTKPEGAALEEINAALEARTEKEIEALEARGLPAREVYDKLKSGAAE